MSHHSQRSTISSHCQVYNKQRGRADPSKWRPRALLFAALLLILSLAPHVAEADKQPPLALVAGVVPCSAGSSINVAAVPLFPNAVVHMVCGGRMVASMKADDSGAFKMNLGAVTSLLLVPLLGNQCRVAVITPLATCNASLASVSGTLAAPVQLLGADSGSGSGTGRLGGLIGLIGQIVGGLLGGILNIIPLPFSVV